MNSRQALAKLRKLLGPRAGIRDSGRPSSPELREQQHAERQAANVAKRAAEAALTARREELIAADPEYQRLAAVYKDARDRQERAPFATYRYSAGTVGTLFFSVTAEADNLDDLIANVAAKTSATPRSPTP